jgi:hypothetical protein
MTTNAVQPTATAKSGTTGVPMSPDEIDQLKRFREKFLPDSKIDARDTYAKWLFGLTTTIAALGTGFSNSAFTKLSSTGVLVYSLAVLTSGAGLAFAVFELSVELPDANWESLDAMIVAFKKPLKDKKSWLIWATLAFGVSLTLASTAVFITALQRRPFEKSSGIGARLSERKLEPAIYLTGIRPGTPAELQIFDEVGGNTTLIGFIHQVADEGGQINYKGSEFKIPGEAQGLKLQLNYFREGNAVSEASEFKFPAETAGTKNVTGGGTTAKSSQLAKQPRAAKKH